MLLGNIIFKILCIIMPLMLMVAIYTYSERKIIGFIQNRIGPNRVGFKGILQPAADIIKLFFKEIIIPEQSNKILFIMAPVFILAMSFSAWAVIPFGKNIVLSNINVGVLYILAIAVFNVYGIVIAGWASNSKYALIGALRAVAQIISYEIAMGLCIVGVVMLSGSMNLTDIVLNQNAGITSWHCWALFPLFIIYFISAIAETNRAPFDVAECESELVAGFHVEYSGLPFAMFFMAEYANMILVSFLASILFLGGWLSPFTNLLTWVSGFFWLFAKSVCFMISFLWIRATFPRYRYDHIMRLGWKIFIPITLIFILIEGVFIVWI